MLLATVVLSLLAPSVVLGQSFTESLYNSTTSTVSCSTYYTSVSPTGPLETYYSNTTIAPRAIVYTSTTTNTRTITKSATTTTTVTSTLTVTVKASSITGTVTSTRTKSFEVTETSTTTLVSTETDQLVTGTTVTATAVVPTPDGFQYIDDTIGTNINYKRDLKISPTEAAAAQHKMKLFMDAMQYPDSVVCVTETQVDYTLEIIKTAKKTSTISVTPSTRTVSKTTSINSTTTDAAAHKTVVVSTTATTTSIATFYNATVTTTETSYLTGTVATYAYAACATNNIIGPQLPDDQYLYIPFLIYEEDYYYVQPSNVSTPVECCVACQQQPGCMVGAWPTTENECFLVVNADSCPQGEQAAVEYSTYSNEYNLILFNGQCGSYYAIGSVG